MKYLIAILLIASLSYDVMGQRNPLGFKEQPIDIFLTKHKPIRLVHSVFELLPMRLDANILIPIETPDSFWSHLNKVSLDLSQLAFVNWNAGGSNSISSLLGINVKRNYKKGLFQWKNEMIIRYGINKQSEQDLRKTDDDLEIVSSLGYKFSNSSDWYYTGRASFKSQFTKGFNYPDRDKFISNFMSPGYLFVGIGAEFYLPEKKFKLNLSPLTQKSTFVLSDRLANQGAFGVQEAITDEDGNIIKPGENARHEVGILINNEYKREIFENINAATRLSLYTDYLNNFGNIDIDWELNFEFEVNDYVKASLGSHIRYDDDIKTRTENEDGETIREGPKVQWKQQLGIGVTVLL